MKRFVLILAVLYLVFLLVGWGVTWSKLNSHWLVTLFLFSPRWVVALPLAGLLPLTLWFRWELSFAYLIHLSVILIPLMGYQVPGIAAKETTGSSNLLRVLTCNVGSGKLDQEEMIQLVRDHQIDVVLLQECQASVAKPLFKELGWQYRQEHQIVIASSMKLGDAVVLANQPESHYNVVAAIACSVDWPGGDRVRLVSVHLPTFRPALQKLQRLDLGEGSVAISRMSEQYRLVAAELHSAIHHENISTVIAGDFNVPIESEFFRNYWQDYRNAFSETGSGFGYTKFTRYHGIRIDHVLVDNHWSVLRSFVGPSLGGDHRPVLVELAKSSAS